MKTEFDISLKTFNTFGIDAKCERFITIENEREFSSLFENKIFNSPFLILGGGSNTLILDTGVRGCVARVVGGDFFMVGVHR